MRHLSFTRNTSAAAIHIPTTSKYLLTKLMTSCHHMHPWQFLSKSDVSTEVMSLFLFFSFFYFLVVNCLLAYDALQWIFPFWSLQFNVHLLCLYMWFCWWVHGCNFYFISVQAYFTLQGSLTRDLRPGNIYPKHWQSSFLDVTSVYRHGILLLTDNVGIAC